jgi:tetratricopeptide (TPR) repeat protein
MRQHLILSLIVFMVIIASQGSTASDSPRPSLCPEKDAVCREFETLVQNEQYAAAVSKVDPRAAYSETTRQFIGKAYLGIASAENNTPEQEEYYCRKALEYGAVQAYMGLYFITVQKDPDAALGYLRQYVATNPRDSVPYVILGEAELAKGRYQEADAFLRASKNVARAGSPRVDWMLFKANYLMENYEEAARMFESAVASGQFDVQVKELASDKRFSGIGDRSEFRKFPQFRGTAAHP